MCLMLPPAAREASLGKNVPKAPGKGRVGLLQAAATTAPIPTRRYSSRMR
jgi:hypothetical protein